MTDARTLTSQLGGRWWRRYGAAPCPVCQPERRKGQDALTVQDGNNGRLLAHCKKSHCDFTDILRAAGIARGEYRAPDPAEIARREAERQAETAKRSRQAEQCWREAQPIAGTAAEAYLRGRGITCALPKTLRFHPACWHGPTATRHPALVALVEGGDGFAVHRTYLRNDGSGKAALEPAKAMLGAVAGGAVRLHANARGDEKGLSAFGHRLRDILETPMPMDEETRELLPRRLPLAPDPRGNYTNSGDTARAGWAHVVRLL